MTIVHDETTNTFSLTGLTFRQLTTVLNCIMYAKEQGMIWPDKTNNLK